MFTFLYHIHKRKVNNWALFLLPQGYLSPKQALTHLHQRPMTLKQSWAGWEKTSRSEEQEHLCLITRNNSWEENFPILGLENQYQQQLFVALYFDREKNVKGHYFKKKKKTM